MHTFDSRDTVIAYNGDYSGDILITDREGDTVVVAFDDIKAFVANYVRTKKVAAIEELNSDRVLACNYLTGVCGCDKRPGCKADG